MLHDVQNVVEVPVLSRKACTLNYRVVISFALPDILNVVSCICSRPGTQRCFQDVIFYAAMRIILIAGQKNYVLEAPLGARPAADAADDIKNVWQSKADDYSIVQCAMLHGLEPGLKKCFERHGEYEMFQESEKDISDSCPCREV